MTVASLKMFAVTGTVAVMGVRSALWSIVLVGLGAALLGCGAANEECDPGQDGFNLWERCDYGETSCQVCSPYTCRWEPGQPSYCGDGYVDPASEERCDGDVDLECADPVGAISGYVAGEVRCDDCRIVADCTWYGSCATVTGPCVTTALPDTAPATHACVLRGDEAECFGDNAHGQARPPDGERFAAIEPGKDYTCALRTDGTLSCWGDDAFGKASPPAGQFVDVGTMPDTACALTASEGRVVCWGTQDLFMNDPPEGTGFHSLTAGGSISCALDAEDHAHCWGVVPFAPPDIALTHVDAGRDGACGLDTDGTLHCWGLRRPAPVEGVLAPQPAGDGVCGTRGDDEVCWGDGVATPTSRVWASSASHASGACHVNTDAEVECASSTCPDITDGSFVGVAIEGDTVCGVTDEGLVWCADCATGSSGQPTEPRQVAVDFESRCSVDVYGVLRCRGFLDGVVLGDFVEVVAGERHACARDVDGRVYCFGELATPPPSGLRARAIAATRRVACAVTTTGTLSCWGDAQALGDLLSPPAGNDFVDVAMGDQHGCALRTSGEVSCWGYELSGELHPPSALRLTTLTDGACGIDTSGVYVCWDASAPRFDEVVCWGEECRALSTTASARVIGFRPDTYDLQPRDFGLITDGCRVAPDGELFYGTNAPVGECNAGEFSSRRPPDDAVILDIASTRNASGQVLCAVMDETPSVSSLRCWGAGFAVGLSHPLQVIGAFTDVSLSVNQLCVLPTSGLPRCFPDGVTPAPPAVALDMITSTLGQTCGVARSDGHIECWGSQVITPPSGAFEEVTLGVGFGCAREADGDVTCWGSSSHDAHVPPAGVRFLSIAATDTHVCGIDQDERLRCWGDYAWNL